MALVSTVRSKSGFPGKIESLGPSLGGIPLFLIAVVFGKDVAKRGAIFLNFVIAVLVMGLSFGLL